MVCAASRPNRSLGDEIRLDAHARFFSSNLGHVPVGSSAAHYKKPRDVACEIPALVRDCGKYHGLVRFAGSLIRKLYRDIMETRSTPCLFRRGLLRQHTGLDREQNISFKDKGKRRRQSRFYTDRL